FLNRSRYNRVSSIKKGINALLARWSCKQRQRGYLSVNYGNSTITFGRELERALPPEQPGHFFFVFNYNQHTECTGVIHYESESKTSQTTNF
ncbi:hypothetical protein NDU88_007196, partial [Pleurodeles waltl]